MIFAVPKATRTRLLPVHSNERTVLWCLMVAAALVLSDTQSALGMDKAVAFRATAHAQDFLPMSKRDILQFEGCATAWSKALADARLSLDDLSFVENP